MALSAATGLLLYAKYPLLPEAKEHVRQHGPSLEALAGDLVYARVRGRAEERVVEALENGFLTPRPLSNPLDVEMELLSFPTARLLVKLLGAGGGKASSAPSGADAPHGGDEWLARRWANAESRRIGKFLQNDPVEASSALADALGVPSERREADDGATFRLHFTDYLLSAPSDRAWKLVARDLTRGAIDLPHEEFARLLEHGVRNKLFGDFTSMPDVPREVEKALRPTIMRLRPILAEQKGKFEGPAITGVEPELFPPCMNKIMNDMGAAVNVAHAGRFAIVTFLHHLGMNSDEILAFFTRLPNFSPEKSRYQIEHITGKTSSTEYSPPSCATMQSHNVCPLDLRDATCFRIKHPLSYYEVRWKQRGSAPPPAAPPAAPAPVPPAAEPPAKPTPSAGVKT